MLSPTLFRGLRPPPRGPQHSRCHPAKSCRATPPRRRLWQHCPAKHNSTDEPAPCLQGRCCSGFESSEVHPPSHQVESPSEAPFPAAAAAQPLDFFALAAAIISCWGMFLQANSAGFCRRNSEQQPSSLLSTTSPIQVFGPPVSQDLD
jgi:hypothetical protein